MTPEQIQEMVENRNVIGQRSPSFHNLVMTRNSRGEHYLQVVKTAAGYFRLLADFAAGNPSIANYYWLQSIRPSGGRTVTVELFKKPDETPLRELRDNQLFVLTAIAQHESLHPSEIAEVIALESGRCEVEVNFLSEIGVLQVEERGTVRLTAAFHRQVMHRLRLSNLLYVEA